MLARVPAAEPGRSVSNSDCLRSARVLRTAQSCSTPATKGSMKAATGGPGAGPQIEVVAQKEAAPGAEYGLAGICSKKLDAPAGAKAWKPRYLKHSPLFFIFIFFWEGYL